MGSDVGPFPHGTQAREFVLMVKFGITPLAAIQADIGVLKPGYAAGLPSFPLNTWRHGPAAFEGHSLSGDGRGGSEPLLHLIMAYQAGLLHHQPATGEDSKIWYATNVEACSKLGMLLRIDL